MLDEKTKMAIALKRFSLISPIINGQVGGIKAYCIELSEQPIDMPHYGLRSYAPSTISGWYSDYVKHGLEGLKPTPRSDRGKTRVLTGDMAEKILAKVGEYPKTPATVLYDMLIEEQAFLRSEVSIATLRRFINANATVITEKEPQNQMFRFAKEHVNELWQTDIMAGPYVKDHKKKRATYLLGYIDDASRLITHAQFYLSQDITVLRHSFKEAVLRRGIPVLLYTDNGKIYRSQSFGYLCANIGVTLLHHGIRLAFQKGKIERFFRTVRTRFLSRLTADDLSSLEKLNERFRNWLDTDYNKKLHEGLEGQTPLDYFLSQSEKIKLPTNLADFNTKFLIKTTRTVKKDATISLNGLLYETDPSLAGNRIDVKYDPDTPLEAIPEVLLFSNDKPVGIARLVNLRDNSYRKRPGRNKYTDGTPPTQLPTQAGTQNRGGMKSHTISYADLDGGK